MKGGIPLTHPLPNLSLGFLAIMTTPIIVFSNSCVHRLNPDFDPATMLEKRDFLCVFSKSPTEEGGIPHTTRSRRFLTIMTTLIILFTNAYISLKNLKKKFLYLRRGSCRLPLSHPARSLLSLIIYPFTRISDPPPSEKIWLRA